MKLIYKFVKKKYFFTLLFLYLLHIGHAFEAHTMEQENNKYVGVDACIDCHADIVDIYRKSSSKATSDKSVLIMREKLTEREYQECLSCHTTGYGEPSGFVSFEKTPHLAMVGCESCHGMGYLHTLDGSPDTISRTPTQKLCITCHDDNKIPRIKYDGRLRAGGH